MKLLIEDLYQGGIGNVFAGMAFVLLLFYDQYILRSDHSIRGNGHMDFSLPSTSH